MQRRSGLQQTNTTAQPALGLPSVAASWCYLLNTFCWLVRRKLVALFRLASQLLLPQQHYDWGLRALKTCLGVAGRLLHEQRKQAQPDAAGPPSRTNSEMQLVLRAVRLATLPKLTFDDNVR